MGTIVPDIQLIKRLASCNYALVVTLSIELCNTIVDESRCCITTFTAFRLTFGFERLFMKTILLFKSLTWAGRCCRRCRPKYEGQFEEVQRFRNFIDKDAVEERDEDVGNHELQPLTAFQVQGKERVGDENH